MAKKLTNNYLSSMCLEMHMLLNAGIAIPTGIDMMLADEKDKDGQLVLQSLLDGLQGGVPLSEAMKPIAYFPPYMVSMIEIGERTGRLSETLKALSEHYERQERLSISIRNATVYPAILLGIMVVVVLILIVQVLPIFNEVFARMGTQMSPFALRLMQFGNWFRGAAVVIAIVFGIVFFLAFLAWVIPGIRSAIVGFFKRHFGEKGIFGRISSLQFVSSMTTALSTGLNIEDSVDMASALNADSPGFAVKASRCQEFLRDGKSLSEALKESGILGSRDSRMLSLGDQAGMADNAMSEIARRSDTSVQDEIAHVVSRIEPTLVIITSVIVGIILLSVMLPMMGIMTSIG